MATGSGKTFTAITSTYRLIKFANACRVLFLVDRANLGRQALKEFQQYVTPDDGRKFTELYNVQHLTSNKLDPVARVCITTNLKRAGRLRQSILKRAFEGELVPQNPKDKPASVLLERIRTERQAEQKATAKAISKPSQKSKRPQVAETQVELFR